MKFNTSYSSVWEFVENTIYINYYYLILVFLYIISDDILKTLEYIIFRLILSLIRIFNMKIHIITKDLIAITKELLILQEYIDVDLSPELEYEIVQYVKKLSDRNVSNFNMINKVKRSYMAVREPIYTYLNNCRNANRALLVVHKIDNLFKNMDDACYFVEENANIILEFV